MFGPVAIGLAVAVNGVPASLAQGSRGLERCTTAATAMEAKELQADQRPASNTGIVVEAPIGLVCVSPEFVGAETVYVRRTTVSPGMTIVEVSTTPFVPEEAAGAVALVRSDQPASW